MTAKSETPKVYAAIAAVMAEIGSEGISKDRKNQQQGYNFRGIDDVYNALSPILAKHKLLMLPRAMSRESVERQTRNGGALFYSTVQMEFTLVSAEDGSQHVIQTYGEAMDSADKSTNKAQSAAFKYAAMQAFCIPTQGDNDADATTHDVAPKGSAEDAFPGDEPARDPAKVKAMVAAISTLADMKTHGQWVKDNNDALKALHPEDYDDVARAWKARAVTIRTMADTEDREAA